MSITNNNYTRRQFGLTMAGTLAAGGIRILHVEALALIEGVSADISVAQALKESDILTAKEMLANSTREQNARRPA